MRFNGQRLVTPLYQHLLHASRPTLGFVGIPLNVPCPIPYFECQAAYVAEAWARGPGSAEELTSEAEREAWVERRLAAVRAIGREQDFHNTKADGGSAWAYMRELLRAVHAKCPPAPEGDSWVQRPTWEARLATMEEVHLAVKKDWYLFLVIT